MTPTLMMAVIGVALASVPVDALSNGTQHIELLRKQRTCKYLANGNPEEFQMNLHEMGEISADGTEQRCGHVYSDSPRSAHEDSRYAVTHCVTIWEERPGATNESAVKIPLIQGCWYGTQQPSCNPVACETRDPFAAMHRNDTFLCCCDEDRCNGAFDYVPRPIGCQPPPECGGGWIFFFCFLIVVGFVAFWTLLLGFRRLFPAHWAAVVGSGKPRRGDRLDSALLLEMGGVDKDEGKSEPVAVLLPPLDISAVTLGEIVGQGRYGSVFRASLSDGTALAVKVYQPKAREFFLNEVAVYQLPLMAHPNLLHFIGWAEVEKERSEGTLQALGGAGDLDGASENGRGGGLTVEEAPSVLLESWLLCAVAEGNLQEHLKTKTLSWTEFLNAAEGLSGGLAFLHSALTQGGLSKPAIAHRDLSSRNVLVDGGGRLRLCDLGFALPLTDSLMLDGDGASLSEVGTVRYMSPEILEGAVNLLDPSAALKAIDVYALGLVLWELLSRCHDVLDLCPGEWDPDYAAPYSREVEATPLTLELMQVWVCRKKVRPALPPALRRIQHPVLRSLRECVEDAWDADAEARPSATCTHYRILDLKTASFDSVVHSAGLGAKNAEEEGRPPSPGALQPYQGLNPCRERNTFHHSSDDNSGAGPVTFAAFGPKADPCSPLTLRQLLADPPRPGKRSNQEHQADNAAPRPEKAQALLDLLRAEVAAEAPTSAATTAAAAPPIALSHANRLFEDRDPPTGRLRTPDESSAGSSASSEWAETPPKEDLPTPRICEPIPT